MIERILVAVDDSVPALAAAQFGIDLAKSFSAELRLVTVVEPDRDPEPILRHLLALAEAADVTATAATLDDGNEPFVPVLRAADDWRADLIVMGRSDKRRTGRPYVGSQTEHLLEFTSVPVVVVPEARGDT